MCNRRHFTCPRKCPCDLLHISARKTMAKDEIVVVCLSGRGDKDVHTLIDAMGGNVQ